MKILIFKILENKGQRFKVKLIRTIVGCIKEVKGNWRFAKQYESDGDSNSIEANGSRNQSTNTDSDLEENWDVKQELYEMPNQGIVLEPRILWTKEQLVWHWVFSIGIGMKRKVWTWL